MFQCDPYTTNKEINSLRAELKKIMPENPATHGWSSYSQTDEDGIIREILLRVQNITPLSKTFIEIGCADGLENNTHQLILDGYKGLWIDGSKEKIDYIKKELGKLQFSRLNVVESYVTKENISQLIETGASFLQVNDIDFFSIDIDGNDSHLLPLILEDITPKVICVEYNAHFPPPTKLTMSYSSSHIWGGDDYYGASLESWVGILDNYSLICCNISGANAFFVHKNFLDAFTVYDIKMVFQPPRYYLCSSKGGHISTLKWLHQELLD